MAMGSGVSVIGAPPPGLVRAKSMPTFEVLNTAQGSDAEKSVWARPACWNLSPEKLAANSSACGAE